MLIVIQSHSPFDAIVASLKPMAAAAATAEAFHDMILGI